MVCREFYVFVANKQSPENGRRFSKVFRRFLHDSVAQDTAKFQQA
jgi:hypothetical protein